MSAFSRARAKVKKVGCDERLTARHGGDPDDINWSYPNRKLYDDYLTEAHEMVKGLVHIPCGTLGHGHHPLEEKIAKACVAAFHRGKASGRR